MSTVPYGKIEGVNKPVSRLFYGTAARPFNNGGDGTGLLDGMLSLGINAIDTARVYGDAEKSVGRWLEKRGCRDKVVLLTKCGHPTPTGEKRVNEKEMRRDFQISSEMLGTGYFDIYLLHRDDESIPAGQLVEVFNAMHAEGKIGAFGGSNWTHRRIEEANEYAWQHHLIPFTVSSPNFGLADVRCDIWGGGSVSVSGPGQREARDWYEKTQMPLISWSSLAGGFFSGRMKYSDREHAEKFLNRYTYQGFASQENFERLRRCEELAAEKNASVSQIALAWLMHQPLNVFAAVATSNLERLQADIDALNLPLTDGECRWLNLEADGRETGK